MHKYFGCLEYSLPGMISSASRVCPAVIMLTLLDTETVCRQHYCTVLFPSSHNMIVFIKLWIYLQSRTNSLEHQASSLLKIL